MFFIYTPQNPSPVYYDPEDAFREYQRREYIRQLEEEQQRAQFERELAMEERRHRAALNEIARRETIRRQRQAQAQAQARTPARTLQQIGSQAQSQLPQVQHQECEHCERPETPYLTPQGVSTLRPHRLPARPTPQEILARRLARQKEEERRSRQFHQNVLSQIFGIPPEEFEETPASDEEDDDYEQLPDIGASVSSHGRPSPPSQNLTSIQVPISSPEEGQPPLQSYIPELPKTKAQQPVRKESSYTFQPASRPAVVHLPEVKPAPTRKFSRKPILVETPEPTPVPASTAHPDIKEQADSAQKKAPSEDKTISDEPLPELGSHWSNALERSKAIAEITSIGRSFNALKGTFVFPSGHLERIPGSDVPRLAYNSTNASIHAYEHALSELLTKLDGIESHGFKGVREARKQLVVKIEKELEDLEKQVAERLAGATSPASKTVAIPVEVPSQEPYSEATPVKASKGVDTKQEAGISVAEDIATENKESHLLTPVATEAPNTLTEFPSPDGTVECPSKTANLFNQPQDSTKADVRDVKNVTESLTEASAETADPVSQHAAMGISPVVQPEESMEVTQNAPIDTQTGAPTEPSKVEESVAPSTTAPALPVALPETLSDEEMEVEDAFRCVSDYELSDKGKKDHNTGIGNFEAI